MVPSRAGHLEDDQALVERARRGDHEAFGLLAERHQTRLRRTLYRLLRDCDAAYDAVQEAITRAWLNLERFEGRSQFSTWLTRIGINEAYRQLERAGARGRARELEFDEAVGERVPDWASLPDAIFESREFLGAVERRLGELPDDYRVAVVLRDVEGLGTAEAAELLGIGERALKSRLHRGRMALRAQLDDYFAEGYA